MGRSELEQSLLAFEAALRVHRPESAASLRPAKSGKEVQDLLADAGLVAGPDALTLWAWHDGADLWAVGVWRFLPLEEALEYYKDFYDSMYDDPDSYPDGLPLLSYNGRDALITRTGQEYESDGTIYARYVEDIEPPQPFADSLSEVIAGFTRALVLGVAPDICYETADLPEHLRRFFP